VRYSTLETRRDVPILWLEEGYFRKKDASGVQEWFEGVSTAFSSVLFREKEKEKKIKEKRNE